eukprot:CAMPEP_0171254750 /NCGR_PEP_ID=MMETSP0790-20130122/52397_1 /TAXON_ID=2925 /ORGANISM="Alexandrium catenella, Strain OF101" /LENGTH=50 /DNA_ID=CAMNT_0011722651 /DNA_START=20 /DNA_END=169 /DNA_ORIENTATION=+
MQVDMPRFDGLNKVDDLLLVWHFVRTVGVSLPSSQVQEPEGLGEGVAAHR